MRPFSGRSTIRSSTAGQIDLFCYEVVQGSKFDLLEYLLKHEKGSFLVFVATKEGADRLALFLERGRHKVACIHGDRSQSQRNAALQGFKDGKSRILVATGVATFQRGPNGSRSQPAREPC